MEIFGKSPVVGSANVLST
ncbi:BnaCnng62900D [Brassica napus]|uniref:BnaCnng62900D protein n=1 Tax=Brassica napus TaxID=3708 RepID=A0A078JUQ7_BRANA|nr:BnaCnng62900D [Brassica napus]